MAITSFGYPGTIDAKTQAVWLPMVSAAQYSVADAGDLRVTARTAVDRGISVAAGTAAGDGVMDVLSTAEASVIPSVTGTNVSRWFMVVLRRNWTTNSSSIVVLAGSATKALPARQNAPGTMSDQPLALVRVEAGKTTIAEIVDLRAWGRSGGMFALDDLVRSYLTDIGTTIRIGTSIWERTLNASLAPVWIRSAGGGAMAYSFSSGFKEPTTTSPYIRRVTLPDPGFPYHIQAHATVEAAGGGPGTRWNVDLLANGVALDSSRGDVTAPWFQMSGNSYGTAKTGMADVGISAIRLYGTGAFGISTLNQIFHVMLIPAL